MIGWRLPAIGAALLLLSVPLLAPALGGASGAAPSSTAAAPGAEEGAPPHALPWDLIDCEFAIAYVFVPKSRIQPYLPEGFTAGVLRGAAAALAPEGTAQLGLEIDVCARGAGLGGPVEGMRYASVWVGAAPPPGLEAGPGVGTFVNFDTLVPDAARRDLLAAHGFPARDGAIDLSWEDAAGLAGSAEATWRLDGLGGLTFAAAGQTAVAEPFTGRFAQFTEAEGGALARWETSYEATAMRRWAGTFRVPEGSWLHDLLGATELPGGYYVGRWSYTGGVLEFPIANPALAAGGAQLPAGAGDSS